MSDTMTDDIHGRIRQTKAELRRSGIDIAGAFAAIDKLIEDQIQTIFDRQLELRHQMALNCGMLASNSQAKEMLKEHYGIEGLPNAVGAGAIAGFFASAFSLPFDYVKTQIQKMQPKPDGTMPYSGMVDCFVKTVSEHGPLRLYTGFPTYYIRIAPHCMITLVALDQIKKLQADKGY